MNCELNKDFINSHLNDDVNKLALSKFPEGVDKDFVIRQIQARQILKKKLPSWSENDELIFPKRLSLEQCSSELTAKYKALVTELVEVYNTTSCLRQAQTPDFQSVQTNISANSCQFVEEKKTLVDLTGGMGVDTSFLSDDFEKTFYVEMQEELCEIAKHNFRVLNKNIEVINDNAEHFLENCPEVDCIYLDPARRDEYGRKMVSLHDCSPDVAELQDLLLKKAKTVIVKLSPMLDIDIIKKELKNIKEIHVVAVRNECKEVLVVLGQRTTDNGQQVLFCELRTGDMEREPELVEGTCDFGTSTGSVTEENDSQPLHLYTFATDLKENWNITFVEDEEQNAQWTLADEIGKYLYEPGVACMKAGCFKLLSQRFNIKKLHRNSHLYTSDELVADFPGRIFEVVDVFPFDKKVKKEISLRCQQTTDNRQQTLSSYCSKLEARSSQPKASVAVRNFPISADELRKQLGVKDGNDYYIFGTTMKGEKKIVVLGVRN